MNSTVPKTAETISKSEGMELVKGAACFASSMPEREEPAFIADDHDCGGAENEFPEQGDTSEVHKALCPLCGIYIGEGSAT